MPASSSHAARSPRWGAWTPRREALRALIDGRFPGKIVIFPALRDLPLTALPDLAAFDPEVAAAFDDGGAWTIEAEAALFARHLPS